MILACLDLEGVLLPEIWINVAEKTGIQELCLTTRDISDYDQLMEHRLKVLKHNNIKMKHIIDVISTMSPLEGAIDFLAKLRERFQVIVLSDTFYQFAMPLMKKMEFPTLFCHDIIVDVNDYLLGYKLRIKDSKRNAVIKLREMNFKIIASGDSYNDIPMLMEADKGILFSPPDNIIKQYPQYPLTFSYDELWEAFVRTEYEILK